MGRWADNGQSSHRKKIQKTDNSLVRAVRQVWQDNDLLYDLGAAPNQQEASARAIGGGKRGNHQTPVQEIFNLFPPSRQPLAALTPPPSLDRPLILQPRDPGSSIGNRIHDAR